MESRPLMSGDENCILACLMSLNPNPTAAVIIIGNEILSGRTQDVNVKFLAERLEALGIRLSEVRIVRDERQTIIDAVNALRQACTYVFTTGGIGPTHDDITSEAVAGAFGVKLQRHPEALKRLQAHYPPEKLNAARLKMADIPQGAALIENPVSYAPGFCLDNVFVMAGVPRILQAMFDQIAPGLKGGAALHTRTITTADHTEGEIAAGLTEIQNQFKDVEIGSYPYFQSGKFGVSLVVRGILEMQVDAAAMAIEELLADNGADGGSRTRTP